MKSIATKVFMLLGGPIFLIKLATAQTSQVLPAFTKLQVEDNVQVEVILADRYSIYIENPSLDLEQVQVTNGSLSLNAENAKGTMVKVYTKSLEILTVDDKARVETLDTLKGNNLTISLQGNSKLKLPVVVTTLSIETQDASECIISGSAQTVTANLQDLAKLSAGQLVIQDLVINANDASKSTVMVKNNFSAKASDLSRITYTGNPAIKSITKDDFAKVENHETILTRNSDENDSNSIAQNDTTRVKIGKRRLMIIEDKKSDKEYSGESSNSKGKRDMKSVWGGFELGVQSFATPQLNLNMPTGYSYLNSNIGNSWFFGFNLPEYDLHIVRNKLALTTGLGWQWSNIHFNGNSYLAPNVDSVSSASAAAGINLTRNKLRTFDYTVPLLVKFAPGSHKKSDGGFHIAVGVIGHYTRNPRVIIENSSLGYNQRQELKDDFNINAFRADATVRIGYDKIKLFANYSLTPYFKNTAANPDVRLFAAGVTLVGF